MIRLNEELMKKAVKRVMETPEYIDAQVELTKRNKISEKLTNTKAMVGYLGGTVANIAFPLVMSATMDLSPVEMSVAMGASCVLETALLATPAIKGFSNMKKKDSISQNIASMVFKEYVSARFEDALINENGYDKDTARVLGREGFESLKAEEYKEELDNYNKAIRIYEVENGVNFDHKDFANDEVEEVIDDIVEEEVIEEGFDQIDTFDALDDEMCL